MKTKFLVSLIALLAVVSFVATSVSAGTLSGVSVSSVNVNGVDLSSSGTLVASTGATAVVRVTFDVSTDYSDRDATLRVWINGKDSQATVKNIVLTTGTHYEYVVLQLPTDISDTGNEVVAVNAEIEAGADAVEASYNLKLQKTTYDVTILDVESDKTVNAGDSLPVTVVLSNNGYRELKNVFTDVSIDELGISKRVYFNDLSSNDSNTDNNGNKQDSSERTVTLKIPTNAKAGEYTMTVEADNSKTSSVVSKIVVVDGSEQEASRVIAPITSKNFNTGDSVSYDIVIVNSGSNIGVYEIVPETTSDLSVSTDTPVVTVAAGASQTVKVTATSSRNGNYNFAVDVNSDGQLVQRVPLAANISAGSMFSGNVAVLTIILAIVFVVLLIVLIVLLTRKPAKSEELEESYY